MSPDHDHADALTRARTAVLDAGADALPRQPWQHPRQPPSDVDLVRFAVHAARNPDVDPNVVAAGLRLLASSRAELDQTEAALLFAARGAGWTWNRVADALGVASPQAAQQRHARVSERANGSDA